MQANIPNTWREELRLELERVTAILSNLGYTLEADQPHIKGDRHLLGGGNKMVLQAVREGRRVVVKASRIPEGIAEIEEEKRIRDALEKLSFAADSLKIPAEVFYGKAEGYVILITDYIDQKEVLASKPLQDRFFIALQALEAMETFHATTYEHLKEARTNFAIFTADDYIRSTREFARSVRAVEGADAATDGVAKLLDKNRALLERHNNYLAHYDFVPHNIRVDGRTIWILDFANMRFGSKYESWARLINYMLIHDVQLAQLLLEHVRDERGTEEAEVLRSMRAFKAALLIAYYARALEKTSGNARELIALRTSLWTDITKKLVAGEPFPEANAEEYIRERDSLVSDEEKERKRGYDLR